MKINSVSSLNFNASKIVIPRNVKENSLANRPYLFNEILGMLRKKESSFTTNFNKDGIEILNPSKKFLEDIKEKGIKFFEKA